MQNNANENGLSMEQNIQIQLDNEETRLIMNKRRKRAEPVEEFDLDEVFTES